MKQLDVVDHLPIEYKGFLYRKTSKALILNSTNFDKAVKIMKRNEIKNLEINSSFFSETALSFVDKFEFIEGISIISNKIENINPIHSLKNLKTLHIDYKLPSHINFEVFKNLEDVLFTWGMKGSESIFNVLSLKKLRIDNFNKTEIFEISNLHELRELELYNSSIINLNGIFQIANLRKLKLIRCRMLEDISSIHWLSNLEELNVDSCKKISSLDAIKTLRNLRVLSFGDVGLIPSIEFLRSLTKLEFAYFVGSTNIKDGNLNGLSWLLKNGSLQTASFIRRKHYTHKPEDLGDKVPEIVAKMFRKR